MNFDRKFYLNQQNTSLWKARWSNREITLCSAWWLTEKSGRGTRRKVCWISLSCVGASRRWRSAVMSRACKRRSRGLRFRVSIRCQRRCWRLRWMEGSRIKRSRIVCWWDACRTRWGVGRGACWCAVCRRCSSILTIRLLRWSFARRFVRRL